MTFFEWILYVLTWFTADPLEVDRQAPRAAASVAAARATLAIPAPDENPKPPAPGPAKCCEDCRGTGFIVHGDGHRTACPCPPDCKCKKAGSCPSGICPAPLPGKSVLR